MEDYPLELRTKPLPVLAIAGSCPSHNKVKEEICAKGYKAVSYGIEDLVDVSSPPKRATYEGYIATGILKANWMHKIMNVQASAVVLLVEWSDRDGRDEKGRPWQVREPEIIQFITTTQKLYQHFRGMNHIVVVFVLAPGITFANSSLAEKVAVLKRKIDFNEKYYCVLVMDDIPTGLPMILANIQELSQSYYSEEVRRLKRDKEMTKRLNLSKVHVRQHFKIAFLNEIRGDLTGARKYYESGYNSLREVPRDNLLEIKVMADYFNYKFCKFLLQSQSVAEIITQFQRHMIYYKPLYKLTECESEHWGWISRQYQVLGELIHEYSQPSSWLTANTSLKHPAYYFHTAASYAHQRKQAAFHSAAKLPADFIQKYSNLNALNFATIDFSKQQFVGQLPSDRSEYENSEWATSLSYEEWHIYRRIVREFNIDHSPIIIELLQRAHSLYSTRPISGNKGISTNCARMKYFICYEIAEEYFEDKKYLHAKEFYDIVRNLSTIITENWSKLASKIYYKSYQCSLELNNIDDFVSNSLELCAPNSHIDQELKNSIQHKFISIIADPVKSNFQVNKETEIIKLIPTQNHPLIHLNCQFTERNVFSNTNLHIRVRIESFFPLPIRFSRMKIFFNNSNYDVERIDDSPPLYNTDNAQVDDNNLVLLPNFPRIFEFTSIAHLKCDLMFEKIELDIGKPSDLTVRFIWEISKWEVDREIALLKLDNHFVQRLSTCILDPKPLVNIDLLHSPPVLVNEYYKIDVEIKNGEHDIEEGYLSFSISQSSSSGQKESKFSFFTLDLTPIESQGLKVNQIPANSTFIQSIFFHATTAVPDRSLSVQLQYKCKEYATQVLKSFPITIISALTARCAFFNGSFILSVDIMENKTTIQADEPSVMRVEVRNNSPNPIDVVDTQIQLNENATCLHSTSEMILKDNPCTLATLDKFTTWFTIMPNTSGNEISIGTLQIKWRRTPTSDNQLVLPPNHDGVITIPTFIPQLNIHPSPFLIDINVPAFAIVGAPISYSMSITNATSKIEEFILSVQDSPDFIISGTKSVHFGVTPLSTFNFLYNLIPNKPGRMNLPVVTVNSKRLSKEITGAKHRRDIFVRPQGF